MMARKTTTQQVKKILGFYFKKFCRRKNLGFGNFGLGKLVLGSVSENLFSEKSFVVGFRKFGLGKKISVSENLVLEKSLSFV